MKKIALLTILGLMAFATYAQEATTFILVRHAEKADDGTRNPPLNEMGQNRAQNLSSLLENQNITALYSTPFKRTRETLQPIADRTSLEVQDYDPFAKGEWLKQLYANHSGGTVVISGHSNTIPALANMLLGEEVFQQFDESEYSNVIIIVSTEVGTGKLVLLNF